MTRLGDSITFGLLLRDVRGLLFSVNGVLGRVGLLLGQSRVVFGVFGPHVWTNFRNCIKIRELPKRILDTFGKIWVTFHSGHLVTLVLRPMLK